MRGRPRTRLATASSILAALRANVPPPEGREPDAVALAAYRDVVALAASRFADVSCPVAHHVWKWRQVARILAELEMDTRRLIGIKGKAA